MLSIAYEGGERNSLQLLTMESLSFMMNIGMNGG